ncbi:hypothetical protein Bbelb_035710 [Branchiostoma belcheri]|nr:hypothetical protein Bbelb_035710 [Branchiostoma belcheri]
MDPNIHLYPRKRQRALAALIKSAKKTGDRRLENWKLARELFLENTTVPGVGTAVWQFIQTKEAASRPRTRVPSGEEKVLEARAIQRLTEIGKNKGPRVKTLFQQYRYDVDNFHRRNRVYRAISGLLTYDLLDIVRDTYPSGEDVNWMLTNQDNRPTKEVGVEDLFDDKV